jgi:hypothetical protein
LHESKKPFQDGVIAQAVDEVVAMGIPYFALAGNHGRKSYESVFRPSVITPPQVGGTDAHDFDPGPGVDTYQQVTVPPGGSAIVTLQWAQPFANLSPGPTLQCASRRGPPR